MTLWWYCHGWSEWDSCKPSHCSKNLFETSMWRIFSNGSLHIKKAFQQLTPGCYEHKIKWKPTFGSIFCQCRWQHCYWFVGSSGLWFKSYNNYCFININKFSTLLSFCIYSILLITFIFWINYQLLIK